MNQSYHLSAARMEGPAVIRYSPFDAITGLLSGSLMGGLLWVAVLAIAFSG